MNIDDFVGVPWADHGRTLDGADCWGLVVLVYQRLLGLDLPHYADSYTTASDRAAVTRLVAGHLNEWVEMPAGQEKRFDGVLMTEAGEPRHMGLVVRPGYVLHMVPGRESVVESYHSGRLARRIVGFFRHESRA